MEHITDYYDEPGMQPLEISKEIFIRNMNLKIEEERMKHGYFIMNREFETFKLNALNENNYTYDYKQDKEIYSYEFSQTVFNYAIKDNKQTAEFKIERKKIEKFLNGFSLYVHTAIKSDKIVISAEFRKV